MHDDRPYIPRLERSYEWGWQVHEASKSNPRPIRVACFKPALGTERETQQLREDLENHLSQFLREPTFEKQAEKVIVDFFAGVLGHLKKHLHNKKAYRSTQKQVVVSVPLCWSMRTCRRLQNLLAQAALDFDFSDRLEAQTGTIAGISFISEPEAAALGILGLTSLDIRRLVSICSPTVPMVTKELTCT